MLEGKWMGLGKIILGLVTQTQKDKCCISPLSVVPSSKSSDEDIHGVTAGARKL